MFVFPKELTIAYKSYRKSFSLSLSLLLFRSKQSQVFFFVSSVPLSLFGLRSLSLVAFLLSLNLNLETHK